MNAKWETGKIRNVSNSFRQDDEIDSLCTVCFKTENVIEGKISYKINQIKN